MSLEVKIPALGAAAGRPDPRLATLIAEGGPSLWIGANVAVTVLYFALGMVVGRFFAAYGLFPAPIWLPTGIATVAALAGGVRLLPGIFCGSFLANAVLFAPPWHVTTIISLTNALGPMAGAAALRRLRPPKGLFTTFGGVIAFVFCTTLLSPAISATGGAVAMSIGAPADLEQFHSIWVNWWLTDAGGTLYLAPALLLWLGIEREGSDIYERVGKQGFDRKDLAVWGWIALVSIVLFLTPPLRGTYIRSAFPFLLVVPLSWIALRMSLRSAYTLVTLVAIVATAGTVAGFGPFQNHSLANPLQLVGTLVVLLAMNVLTIVALVSERYEAQTANKVKSMFLANTSHELRAPLNAIIGYSSLIDSQAAGPLPNEQYLGYARLIQASGEHLLALINDLLEMSKIEAGRFSLTEEPVTLALAIEEAAELTGVMARAKSITLDAGVGAGGDIGDGVTVVADAKALRQILLNLLSNAIKFTPEGGRVAVSAALGRRGEVTVRVSDTGIGIPPDALDRVFRPFERAHEKGSTRRIEGTGLGLSITLGLVKLHGGTVELESTVGQGTTVTVTLPASRVVATKAAAREDGRMLETAAR